MTATELAKQTAEQAAKKAEPWAKTKLRDVCRALGKNNDPVFAVLGIAVFKGIFRPTFTMMDKHEKPEVKKYAAFREGLTEAIAFCSYLVTSLAAHGLAKVLCKDPTKLHKMEKSLSFHAVCISAAVIIPYVCNKTLKPIMDSFQKNKKSREITKSNEAAKLDIKETEVIDKPVTQTMTYLTSNHPKQLLESVNKPMAFRHSNMKVGA